MQRVIDLDLPIPPSAEEIAARMKLWALGRGEKGGANYRYIFGPSMAREFGTSIDELEMMSKEMSPQDFEKKLLDMRLTNTNTRTYYQPEAGTIQIWKSRTIGIRNDTASAPS